MALALNDLLQFVDVQTYLNQTVLNVYHYRLLSMESLVDYVDLVDQLQVLVFAKVRDIQVTGVTHTRCIATNLTNGVDIYEQVTTDAGTVAGDGLPSLVAASFRLVRTNLTTRHGAKRIAGLAESQNAYNDPISAAVAAFNAVATAMGSNVTQTGTVDHDFDMEPVIIGRYPQGHAQQGELNLSVVNPVQSAQFIRISSQTTRRAGRGV